MRVRVYTDLGDGNDVDFYTAEQFDTLGEAQGYIGLMALTESLTGTIAMTDTNGIQRILSPEFLDERGLIMEIVD